MQAGQQLALVTLRGSIGIAVRDVTDVLHPLNRCTISGQGFGFFRFISATRISYIAAQNGNLAAASGLYMVDLPTQTTSLVRSWSSTGYGDWSYAWSPNGQRLTYVTSDTNAVEWHVLSSAGDRTLTKLGPVPGRDVDPNSDDWMVGFSADGKYVAFEETITYKGAAASGSPAPFQVVRLSDNKLVYSRNDGTMAVWAGSGATLYFRTSGGVQSWDASGKVRTVAAGVAWVHPWASADGKRVVYTTVNSNGNHQAAVLILAGATLHPLSSEARVGAAFLTSNLVWYEGETVCTTATPCGLGGPPLTGQSYIYDVSEDVESQSIDTAFFDSWPHAAGQS